MPFKAALAGLRRLHRANVREERAMRRATRQGVDETSRAIQRAVRRDVDRIFSGSSQQLSRRKTPRRVSGAIRRKLFDNGDRGTAALIYSKFGRRARGRFIDYLGPYITGRDIRPRRGRFMAIPLQRGRKSRRPENFDDLRPVVIAGRLYLVRTTRTRTRFMFLLIPRVRISKRLRARRIAIREAKRMGVRVRQAFGRV